MVSFGLSIQEQLFGQFLKSGLFDTITVTPARLGFGPGMRGRPERTGSQKAAGGSQAKTPAPLLDDDALKKFAAIDRVREVSPNVRVPAEVKHGSFSEFTAAAGIPMSARNEGVFRSMSRGSFFAADAADACILVQSLAARMVEGDTGRLILLVEAAIIGLTGGVLGILLGWVVGRAINFGANIYNQSQGGPTGDLFSLPAWLIAGVILFSILTSLVAGSYPASRAARLDPIQALRHD